MEQYNRSEIIEKSIEEKNMEERDSSLLKIRNNEIFSKDKSCGKCAKNGVDCKKIRK